MHPSIKSLLIVVGSFAVGYGLFRTHTGNAVAAVAQVATWRVQSAAKGAVTGSRTSAKKVEVFFALCERPSSISRDAQLFAAMESMTKEDFHAVASDILSLDERGSKLPPALQEALAEAAMNRWLNIDPDDAKAWIIASTSILEQMLPRGVWVSDVPAFKGMIKVLGRREPDWTLNHAPTVSKQMGRPQAIMSAFEQLTARDPLKAQDQLAQLQDSNVSNDRTMATLGYATALAKIDPLAAVTMTKDLSVAGYNDVSELRDEILLAAGRTALGKGEAALRELLQQTNDPNIRGPMLKAGLRALAEDGRMSTVRTLIQEQVTGESRLWDDGFVGSELAKDPKATVQWLAQLPPEIQQRMGTGFRQEFVNAWVKIDPEAASSWAMQQPARADDLDWNAYSEFGDIRQSAIGKWYTADPEAAKAWTDKLPPGTQKDQAALTLANQDFRSGKLDAAADAYCSLAGIDANSEPAKKMRESLVSVAMNARNDFQTISRGLPAKEGALELLTTAWISNDPGEAAAWLQSLPSGSERDTGCNAFAEFTAPLDPETASDWLNQVQDPKLRTKTAATIFYAWSHSDPIRARDWVRTLPGVDEPWRQSFLRRVR